MRQKENCKAVDRERKQAKSSSEEQRWGTIEKQRRRFARWKEHFKKVLNKEISESLPQEEQEQRTEKEARYFCRDTLNTRRKSCIDGAQKEESPWSRSDNCRNVEIRLSPDQPKTQIHQIWKEEIVHKECIKRLIRQIPQKGNLQECGNGDE